MIQYILQYTCIGNLAHVMSNIAVFPQYTCIGNLAHVMSNIAVFPDMAQLIAFLGDFRGRGHNQYIQTKKNISTKF